MSVTLSRASPARRVPGVSYTSTVAGVALPFSLTVMAAVLWADSLSRVDLGGMTGLGLISVLPIQTFVALALYVAGFVFGLYQPRILTPLVLLQLGVWVVMLHGINSLVVSEPVFNVAWRHAGISEYILRNRGLDPNIDAYFSWPGFFGMSALATKVAALASPVNLIRWAPPFFNLLYLTPLALIFKSAASDVRTVGLGLWFFYTTNWISQDYFSPQAFAYFAYLLVLGILLRWFVQEEGRPLVKLHRWLGPGKRTLRRPPGGIEDLGARITLPSSTRSERLLAASILIIVFGATVSSHQLTPFALVLTVGLLVAARQVTLRGLPTLMTVLIGVWISYMTVAFLAGHLELVFKPLGLKESTAVNVEERLRGSGEHLIVVYGRLAMTALVWALAALGALRARRSLNRYLACLISAVGPFALLILQPYGGEMLLRVYLLILPFCALFLAGLLAVRGSSSSRTAARACLATLVSVVLVSGFLLSRYGNETIDRFTSDEVRAVSQLYRMAPRGSLLLAAQGNLPWRYKEYGSYQYKTLGEYNLSFKNEESLVASVARILKTHRGPDAFLIITRGQKEAVSLLGIPAPTKASQLQFSDHRRWLVDLEQALREAPAFDAVFAGEDGTIFALSK